MCSNRFNIDGSLLLLSLCHLPDLGHWQRTVHPSSVHILDLLHRACPRFCKDWCLGLQDNRMMARQVLWRILQLGLAVGLVMALVLSVSKSLIPSLFSQDPGVHKMALSCMPFLALCMVSSGVCWGCCSISAHTL